MTYLDTSVLVAYYCPEPLSRASQRAVQGVHFPAISLLTDVELCSALSLKTRLDEMPVEAARRVLACFRMHVTDGKYRIVSVDANAYALASEWLSACTTPLRTVDALHLAVAFAHDLVLMTADRGLAKSAAHFGVKHKMIS